MEAIDALHVMNCIRQCSAALDQYAQPIVSQDQYEQWIYRKNYPHLQINGLALDQI